MLPGAISLEGFSAKKDEFRARKIAVYCTIGYRSAKIARQLIKKGFRAHNLEGSLLGWIHRGGHLVDEKSKRTLKIHVYESSWNWVPRGYQAIWD